MNSPAFAVAFRPTFKMSLLPLLTWAVLLLFLPLPPELSPRLALGMVGEGALSPWRWPFAVLVAGVVGVSLWRRRPSLDALLVGARALSLFAAFAVVRDGTLMAFWGAGWWLAFFGVLGLSASDRLFLIQLCLWVFGAQIVATLGAYFLHYNSFMTPRFGARAGGMMGSPNEIYPWSLIWCGVFYGAARGATNPRVQTALWAGALGSVAVLMLTFSRAGWIGLALVAPFLAGAVLKTPAKWHHAGVWIVALALLFGAATIRTHGEILSPDNDGSTYGRVRIWKTSWTLFREKPLWGHGVGRIARRTDLDVDFVEPKNLYAQFALERGVVGLALFGIFAGGLWVRARRVSKCDSHDAGALIAARALTLALPALLVAGLFDTPIFGHFERILPTLSFLLLAGLVAGVPLPRLALQVAEEAVKIKHTPAKIAATLQQLHTEMAVIGVAYFVIGSCARKAYLGEVGPIADVDIVTFERRKRHQVREVLARVSRESGVEVDDSLSRYFEVRGGAYFLVHGRLRVPVQSCVFETRWVQWQNVFLPTFAPQTLLHFFNCLVATPLRPKDKPAIFQFARFVRNRREFGHDLLVPFHIFVARRRYLPLRALQLWWRGQLKRLSPRAHRWVLRFYQMWPSRAARGIYNFFVPLVSLRPPKTRPHRGRKRPVAFTLVEILVVLGVVALLAALLLPVLSQARERGRRTVCTSMLADFGRAFHLYAQDYDGRFPNPGGRGMQGNATVRAVEAGDNGAAWYSPGQVTDGRIVDRGALLPYIERVKKNQNNDWACPDAMEAQPLTGKPTTAMGQSYTMNDYLREGHPGEAKIAEEDAPAQFNPAYHTGASLSQVGTGDGHSAAEVILLFEAVQRNSGSVNRDGSPYWGRDWLSRYGAGDLPQGAPEEYHQGLSNFLFCDGHVKALIPTRTWTSQTQSAVVELNPAYAKARGGRTGQGIVDLWNSRLPMVHYP
jgi:prepilin-type processing-associated H-X9-DG protein